MTVEPARRLPPPQSFRQAAREQLRLISLGHRRELLFLLLGAIALAVMSSLPVRVPAVWVGAPDADGLRRVEFGWWRMDEIPAFLYPELWPLFLGYMILTLVGLIWPLSIWRGESPRCRDAFWSLPIAGPSHELARVAAGAVCLVAVSVTVAASASLGLLASRYGATLEVLSTRSWVCFVTGPLTLYLLGSIAALRAERPGRAVFAAILVLFVPFALFATIEFQPGYEILGAVISGKLSYSAALSGPIEEIMGATPNAGAGRFVPWAIVLWLVLGVTGCVCAARWRHDT